MLVCFRQTKPCSVQISACHALSLSSRRPFRAQWYCLKSGMPQKPCLFECTTYSAPQRARQPKPCTWFALHSSTQAQLVLLETARLRVLCIMSANDVLRGMWAHRLHGRHPLSRFRCSSLRQRPRVTFSRLYQLAHFLLWVSITRCL